MELLYISIYCFLLYTEISNDNNKICDRSCLLIYFSIFHSNPHNIQAYECRLVFFLRIIPVSFSLPLRVFHSRQVLDFCRSLAPVNLHSSARFELEMNKGFGCCTLYFMHFGTDSGFTSGKALFLDQAVEDPLSGMCLLA